VEVIVFGEDAAEVCSELGLVRRAVVERLTYGQEKNLEFIRL
jgi:hypothetical protein